MAHRRACRKRGRNADTAYCCSARQPCLPTCIPPRCMPCAQHMCCIAACRIAPSRVPPTPTPQPAHHPALSRRCLPRVTPGFRQVARRPAQSCAVSATGGAEHAHHPRACVSTVLRSLSCRAARSGNLGRGEQSACRQAGSLTGRPVARSFFAPRHTPTASPSSMAQRPLDQSQGYASPPRLV